MCNSSFGRSSRMCSLYEDPSWRRKTTLSTTEKLERFKTVEIHEKILYLHRLPAKIEEWRMETKTQGTRYRGRTNTGLALANTRNRNCVQSSHSFSRSQGFWFLHLFLVPPYKGSIRDAENIHCSGEFPSADCQQRITLSSGFMVRYTCEFSVDGRSFWIARAPPDSEILTVHVHLVFYVIAS